MPIRTLPVALLLAAALSSVGSRCGPPVLAIVHPRAGKLVEGCEVELRVKLWRRADPATLSAELNGTPITLVQQGRTPFYSATVESGPLLQASNTFTASVERVGGGPTSETRVFDFRSSELRARRISAASAADDLIVGPAADGKVGDWVLANCKARYVIQDGPQRDLTGIAQYGGNIIDAELAGRPGRDNFFEMQPSLNIETVVNADVVEVVNDGSNGEAAEIRACGPDDLLDYINPSTLVGDLSPIPFNPDADDNDQDVSACTHYLLAPGDSHLEVTTIVSNPAPQPLGLFVGDYINGGGELEQWTDDGPVANAVSGSGEQDVTSSVGVFSFFGFGEGEGVDYAYVPLDQGSLATSSFTQSGVSAILHSHSVLTVLFFGFPPTFVVPAEVGGIPGENSFTRWFGVGDGSGANGLDLKIAELGIDAGTLKGCVTRAGAPAPGTRVVAGEQAGGQITRVRSIFVADADGCYEGRLPVGSYGVVAARKGSPYEGGGPLPLVHPVAIASGNVTIQDLALPATGRVRVTVVDETGVPVPARIGVVGQDPSPDIVFSGSVGGVLTVRAALFHDATRDPIPDGLTWVAYAGGDGVAEFDLEPTSGGATYDIVVSRGTEYSAYTETVTVAAGATTEVAAQIAHVLDTTGFVSSDFHVHMLPSSDSRINLTHRVMQFAGEGVDNIIATDHDRHTDLLPKIAELGLGGFVHATVGEEITSFDYGHFNAYPLGIDPDRVSGGSTDWALPALDGGGQLAVGEDFPSSGNFSGTPAQIFDRVFTTTRVAGGLLNTSPGLAVQVNHIGSHFGPLKIDTSLTPPSSQFSEAEKAARRFCSGEVAGSCATVGELFFAFPALELWNGYTRGHALGEFLNERLGIWANLLNQGIRATAIYDTDTHAFFNTRAGGARTWTAASTDDPAGIDADEVGAAVNAGRAVGGQGIYPQLRVFATNTPGNEASFELAGSTEVTVPDGQVTLQIRVQAPTWAPFDRIEIYRNPTTTVTGCNGTTPVDFKANPSDVLVKDVDFSVTTVDVHPGVAGAQRLEATALGSGAPLEFAHALGVDTWFAVVARGTDGVSASMFPVMPASLSQGGVLALGATNALYVDVDGGGFDPPGVACTNCATFCGP